MNKWQKLKVIVLVIIVLALGLLTLGIGYFSCGFKDVCDQGEYVVNLTITLIVLVAGGSFVRKYVEGLRTNRPVFSNTDRAEKTLMTFIYITAAVLLILFLKKKRG